MSNEVYTTVKLDNGDVATVMVVKGHHLMQAAFMAGSFEPVKVSFHLISLCALINGSKLTFEEVCELPIGTIGIIQELINNQSEKIKFR